MTSYKQHVANEDGWSDWSYPDPDAYRHACCDCGLVHIRQFRIEEGHIEYRSRRDNRATAQIRRHLKKRNATT